MRDVKDSAGFALGYALDQLYDSNSGLRRAARYGLDVVALVGISMVLSDNPTSRKADFRPAKPGIQREIENKSLKAPIRQRRVQRRAYA